MKNLEVLRAELPEFAKDTKLNLQTVFQNSSLNDDQLWGVAVCAAASTRNARLLEAVLADAQATIGADVIDDALAAATLMGMNNVYYRFRHMVGKEAYSKKPARLRMNRMAKPATNKADFELFSLAVSAINGCEACIQSHEPVVLKGGLTEDAVHDAVRVAATIQAAAVALEIPATASVSVSAEA